MAYVFGSFARDAVGPLSDFDIAVLFSKKISAEDCLNHQLELVTEVGGIVNISRVDVINLETVESPVLKHKAVFESVPILVKDSGIKFSVEKQTMQGYEDTKYLRETNYRIMTRQIKDGTFGKAPFSPRQEKLIAQYAHR